MTLLNNYMGGNLFQIQGDWNSWTAVHVVTKRTRRACEADCYTYISAELKNCSDTTIKVLWFLWFLVIRSLISRLV